LLGQFVEVEERRAVGRADAVVKTKDTIYVFEFNLDGGGSVEKALKQIVGNEYMLLYTADGRVL
jgi:hypothetical protein